MLSHQRIGGCESPRPSLEIKEVSHVIFAATLARALYYDLVLKRATVGCFLQLQEIRLAPKKMQWPLVERQSSLSPT
jgi:hypothetical protein